MSKHWKILALLVVAVLLLNGCALLTLDELYCPPKRSEEYENLQEVIDEEMKELEYSAPISGAHRQAVQNVDLDGDGVDEYLLFAKDDSENPLKILIFSQIASGYVLLDTIEGYGVAYDFVEYAQLDDRPGVEIIVGCRVSEDLACAVSVYRFTTDLARLLLSTGYVAMTVNDLDLDGRSELVLLNSGGSDRSKGVAMLYAFTDGELQRTDVSYMSQPIGKFHQLESGLLEDGMPAVFVTSAESENMLVLDVFALQDASLTNMSNGIRIPAVRNYLVYPTDIDEDGIIEIPMPVSMHSGSEYLMEWYSIDWNGEHRKAYTYHQFVGGWYIFLEEAWVSHMAVELVEDGCVFYWQDAVSGDRIQLMTIYTFTGSDRELQAEQEGIKVLYRGDSIIYAVAMEEQADDMLITEEKLMEIFHPIRKELNTEESGE